MQAIILAAGLGRRLKKLTANNAKTMVEVNGVKLIERMLNQLDSKNLSKITIVVGYQKENLIKFIESLGLSTPIDYVENPIADVTNNIYSLYLAKDVMLKEDTLLLESDLIFEDKLLDVIIDDPYPNLALVDKYEAWMDGTVVVIDEDNSISRFVPKKDFRFDEIDQYYKTVNIYKFSKSFSNSHYVPFLEAYCKALGHNEYYEQVLNVITNLDKPDIKAVPLNGESWYEIDDVQDLNIAESIFADEPYDRMAKMHKRYGGFWRYPKLIDFCYLVNPYFPNKRLLDEMKSNFDVLITQYPSGLSINSLLVGNFYGIPEEYLCVGNGAAEIINALMSDIDEKIGIIYPTFEEYPNRLSPNQVVGYYPDNRDFSYCADDIINYYNDVEKSIGMLNIINPDNPSGNYLSTQDIQKLIAWAKEKGIMLLIDESFVDFSEDSIDASLLDEDILEKNKHLIVIKSMSKSFGIPGIRLGFAASSNNEIISTLRNKVSIWNINSFGEFFLQIFTKYRDKYIESNKLLDKTRCKFISDLSSVSNLRVIPSQANYVAVEILGGMNASYITEKLLIDYNILIKDLTGKEGVPSDSFVRLAIRDENDNNILISALKAIMNGN